MLALKNIFPSAQNSQKHQNKSFSLFIIISLAFLYFMSGKVSLLIPHGKDTVTIAIFAAEGFSLAAALLFGKRVWVGVFFGQLLLALSEHIDFLPALFISISNSLEVILAVYFYKHFNFSLKFDNLKDTMKFIIMIVFVLQPFSAITGTTIFYFFSVITYSTLTNALFSWWFGNIMGQLLITTALLILYYNYKKIHYLELFIYTLFFTLVGYLFIIGINLQNISILHSITITFIIFLIAYRELVYASFATIGIAVVTTYSIYLDVGMFTQQSFIQNIINVNMYILAHILVVLVIGTLFNERKNREQVLQKSIQDALDENRQQQEIMLQQNRLAQMGEVINMIAHQWRQPLNNLSIINQTLLVKYKRKVFNETTIENFAENSNRQIQEMSKVIDNFRNFFEPRREKTDFYIQDIVEHVLDLTQPILEIHSITVHFTPQEKNSSYNGYSNELGQTILNIINNAKDAFVENEITDKNIYIAVKSDQEKIVITIQDNAGGISEDIIQNVFDPYFSTKLHKNGTGLGLYMSKNIIENHMMGELSVININGGAKFTIVLPISSSI